MQAQDVISASQKLIDLQRTTDAVERLQQALTDLPHSFELWTQLSKCLFELCQYKEAIKAAQQADSVDPFANDFAQIQSYVQQGAFSQAAQAAQALLKKSESHPKAFSTLAHIETIKNNPEAAIKLLEQGLRASPANVALRNMLSNSYASAGYFANALKSAQTLVEIDESFDSLWMLIGLQFKYAQYEDLLRTCQRASSILLETTSSSEALSLPKDMSQKGLSPKQSSPEIRQKRAQLELMQGQALRIVGKKHQSIAALKASLENDPSNADAWWALADMKDYSFSDNEYQAIQALANEPSNQGNDNQQRIKYTAAFALAKAHEFTKSPHEAMALYKQANSLASPARFTPKSIENEFSARAQSYANKNLSTQANNVERSITPIFIVGLPRSGSTLVEQILASHPDIIGTIEQPTLPIIESRAQNLCVKNHNMSLSSGLAKLTPTELSSLGQAYLQESAVFRHKASRFFIDKQPFNFRLVGLIHKILPHAKVIDVRRHPLDCGYSLYKQFFHSGVDFSYRLDHIGRVYQAYFKLMEHWETELPAKVFRLKYEMLVHDTETQVRKLLDWLGLDFNEQCLAFHKTKRAIHTASSEQVRQAINLKGIGTYKAVEHELKELIDNLGSISGDNY